MTAPKKFSTIMADPPWPYDTNGPVAGEAHHKHVGLKNHYPTMTMAELCAMPVEKVAEKNAHLYLWFTNSFAVEAHDLARAWGFEPKTIVTWVKTQKSFSTLPSMGTGFYFRGATEHMLFCVRGSLLTTQSPPRPNVVMLPREGHSVKPQFFYDLAEQQSPGPYLEIFARRDRPRWERFGNEVDSTVDLNPQLKLALEVA